MYVPPDNSPTGANDMRMTIASALAVFAACGGSKPAPSTTPDPGGNPPQPVEASSEVKEAPPPPPAPPAPKPMTLEERVAFHEGCFKDFLAEKPDFFDRCYTAESSDEMVDGGQPPAVGPEAIRTMNKPFWDGFTLKGESQLTIASGDNVFVVALMNLTNDGQFMGAPPTKKTSGVLFAEVQNLDAKGRHGTVRGYVDLGTFMAHINGAPKGMKVRPSLELTGKPGVTLIGTGSDAENANMATVKSGFEKFNAKDWKGLSALYTADAVISQQNLPVDQKGTKEIDKMFKELSKAFPDAKEEVVTTWAAGDYVVAETVFTGTNKAAAPGMGIAKATKKPVTLRTAHVMQLEGGKVKKHLVFSNGLAMAMQLGLIKPPAPPKADAAAPAATTPAKK
jgi:ketosteroid isomerase-like protein